jgi:hypothetical protein
LPNELKFERNLVGKVQAKTTGGRRTADHKSLWETKEKSGNETDQRDQAACAFHFLFLMFGALALQFSLCL